MHSSCARRRLVTNSGIFFIVVSKWMSANSLLCWCSWVHIFVQRKRGKRWATYCVRSRNRVYIPCNHTWRYPRPDHSYSILLCIQLSHSSIHTEKYLSQLTLVSQLLSAQQLYGDSCAVIHCCLSLVPSSVDPSLHRQNSKLHGLDMSVKGCNHEASSDLGVM